MNLASVLIAALVATLFIAVIVRRVKMHRQGRPSCSCGCDGCSMNGACRIEGK